MKRVLKWVFGIFAGLIVIGLIFGDKTDTTTATTAQTETATTAEPVAFVGASSIRD